MFITGTNNIPRRWITLVMAAIITLNLCAQDVQVLPLSKTILPTTITEIFAYASGGFSKNSSLGTANNNLKTQKNDIWGTYFDIGSAFSFYNTKREWFRFNASLGYKYQVYSDKNLFSSSAGVYTHWMTFDVSPTFGWLGLGLSIGLKTDIFLKSIIKNTDHFSYEGLYSDCFNKASLCYYMGYSFQFRAFKIEGRIGTYFIPQINPQKTAYYNLTNAKTSGFYFELRLFYRIFTTGKISKTPGNKLL